MKRELTSVNPILFTDPNLTDPRTDFPPESSLAGEEKVRESGQWNVCALERALEGEMSASRVYERPHAQDTADNPLENVCENVRLTHVRSQSPFKKTT